MQRACRRVTKGMHGGAVYSGAEGAGMQVGMQLLGGRLWGCNGMQVVVGMQRHAAGMHARLISSKMVVMKVATHMRQSLASLASGIPLLVSATLALPPGLPTAREAQALQGDREQLGKRWLLHRPVTH